MTDRVYYRANFSSSTTPTSSGGKRLNEDGDEYAVIPLQLPSNLIDHNNPPRGIEMMLSKLSIPLNRVPICSLPVREVNSQGKIITDAFISIWPFEVKGGEILPTGLSINWSAPYYKQGEATSPAWRWPVARLSPELNQLKEEISYQSKLTRIAQEKEFHFYSMHSVLDLINDTLKNLFTTILNAYGTGTFAAGNAFFIPEFYIEHNNLHFRMRINSNTSGNSWGLIPFTTAIVSDSGRKVGPAPVVTKKVPFDPSGVTALYSNYSCFSIIVNKTLRDLLYPLPWIEVDNSKLPKFRQNGTYGVGPEIPGWYHNTGTNTFYVLDFSSALLTIMPGDNAVQASANDSIYYNTTFSFEFPDLDLTSLIDISSFVVQMNGLDLTQQTYPINILQSTNSAALTTNVPIIEVYYPLWNTISDMSTNLIISKDVFTNAAPIVLNRNAMYERNFSLVISYITKTGKLKQVFIPPDSNLSLQITFSFIN